MALVTTIRWRPYPDDKPPAEKLWTVFVVLDSETGEVGTAIYHDGGFGAAAPLGNVTHFALPEDITTEEA